MRTNAWGLSSRLKAVLEWLPIRLGETGEGSAEHSVGEETADSTGLAAAGGNEAIADTTSGGVSSIGDSTVAVANGGAGTIADSTATATNGDITAKTGADSSASIAGDSTVVDRATSSTKAPVAGSGTGVPPLDGNVSAGSSGATPGADGLPVPAYVDVQGNPVRGLFNEDMVVNLDDFFLFASQFGMASGQGGFDPHFDLDQNGVINLADFFIFADNFGREAVSTF